jgi:hypothetical protein
MLTTNAADMHILILVEDAVESELVLTVKADHHAFLV